MSVKLSLSHYLCLYLSLFIAVSLSNYVYTHLCLYISSFCHFVSVSFYLSIYPIYLGLADFVYESFQEQVDAIEYSFVNTNCQC